MSISSTVGKISVPFTNWRPGCALLNRPLIAVDTETELVTPAAAPRLVITSATDGEIGIFVANQNIPAFLAAHPHACWVFHNAAFDVPVLEQTGADFTGLIESGRVFDTAILYRLIKLDDTGNCHGKWSLDYVLKELLGIDLPKDVMSADGQPVRTTFGRFLRPDGTPDYPALIKPEHRPYLEYAAADPVATLLIADALKRKAQELHGSSLNIFDRTTYGNVGEIDHVNVGRAWQTHGFETHDIQLKASLALAASEKRGMCLDKEMISDAIGDLDADLEKEKNALETFDWKPGEGSHKRLDVILAGLERNTFSERLPRTESGKYSHCADDLEEYRGRSKFIDAYLRFQELNKVRNTFMAPLEKGGTVVRGRFNLLVNTGRTSCTGSRNEDGERSGLNLQNLPREGSVRRCLIASPGHLLLACDYSTIELTTLAQNSLARFGFSKMAEAIQRGADLHALDAAFRAGININALPSWDKKTILPLLGPDADKLRDKSKAKNFGLPGGLGAKTFVEFARAAYAVEMTEEQAKEEKEQWLRMWPEMKNHLSSNEVEIFANHYIDLWRTHPIVLNNSSFEGIPWPFHIFKGVVAGQTKTKTKGRPYTQEEIQWAWRIAEHIAPQTPGLSETQRTILDTFIREHIAGPDLWHMLAPRQRYTATLTGRLRGYPTFCAAKNCPFQGLAADGAKKALYRLHREGFRVVNFIHDEVLVEFPINADHNALAQRVEKIMIDEMRSVVPDVPVTCEYALMRRWYKGAKAVVENGRLVPSKPVTTASGKVVWVRD